MESLPFHRRVLVRFSRVPVALFAAALSYYALLGLFPLLLLLVGLAGLVLAKSPELYASFEGELRVLVTRLFPAAEGAAKEILDALTKGATGFTLGSAVLLFWTASHFFTALSSVLSEVFGTRPRPWQTRFLGLLGPVMLGLALMLVSALSLVLGLVVGLLPEGPLEVDEWAPGRSPRGTRAPFLDGFPAVRRPWASAESRAGVVSVGVQEVGEALDWLGRKPLRARCTSHPMRKVQTKVDRMCGASRKRYPFDPFGFHNLQRRPVARRLNPDVQM